MENLSSVMPTRVRERMLNQECVKAHGRLFSYLELSRVGPVTYFHIRSRKVLVQLFPFSLLSNFSIWRSQFSQFVGSHGRHRRPPPSCSRSQCVPCSTATSEVSGLTVSIKPMQPNYLQVTDFVGHGEDEDFYAASPLRSLCLTFERSWLPA